MGKNMTIAARDYERAVAAAVSKSYLARFPAAARDALLSRSTRIEVPARGVFFRSGEAPRTALLISGLGRIAVVNESGDDLTVLWAHAGEWIGAATVVDPARPVFVRFFPPASTPPPSLAFPPPSLPTPPPPPS